LDQAARRRQALLPSAFRPKSRRRVCIRKWPISTALKSELYRAVQEEREAKFMEIILTPHGDERSATFEAIFLESLWFRLKAKPRPKTAFRL
jgi:hypothetical protein